MTLEGAGAATTIIDASQMNARDRILRIDPGRTTVIKAVTMRRKREHRWGHSQSGRIDRRRRDIARVSRKQRRRNLQRSGRRGDPYPVKSARITMPSVVADCITWASWRSIGPPLALETAPPPLEVEVELRIFTTLDSTPVY